MRWRIALVALGFILAYTLKPNAQEPHARLSHDLTLKEAIEIVADFDVKHVEQQPFFQPAYGVTDFSSSPPAIWIFSAQTFTSKLSTAIHEMIHIQCAKEGVTCSEEYVNEQEVAQYKKIFGRAPE